MKEQVEEMKRKEERMEKQMNEIMAENRRLTEPLQRAREEVQELQREVFLFFKFVSKRRPISKAVVPLGLVKDIIFDNAGLWNSYAFSFRGRGLGKGITF